MVLVVGTLYQSLSKLLEDEVLDTLIELTKSKVVLIGSEHDSKNSDSKSRLTTERGKKLTRNADRNHVYVSV